MAPVFTQVQSNAVCTSYKAFISQIAKLEQQARYWSLRLFENNLLSELGYGYDLENDIHGDDIAQGAYYQCGYMVNIDT
jgi:recombinational DNA repair protein (RecF pathway)